MPIKFIALPHTNIQIYLCPFLACKHKGGGLIHLSVCIFNLWNWLISTKYGFGGLSWKFLGKFKFGSHQPLTLNKAEIRHLTFPQKWITYKSLVEYNTLMLLRPTSFIWTFQFHLYLIVFKGKKILTAVWLALYDTFVFGMNKHQA